MRILGIDTSATSSGVALAGPEEGIETSRRREPGPLGTSPSPRPRRPRRARLALAALDASPWRPGRARSRDPDRARDGERSRLGARDTRRGCVEPRGPGLLRPIGPSDRGRPRCRTRRGVRRTVRPGGRAARASLGGPRGRARSGLRRSRPCGDRVFGAAAAAHAGLVRKLGPTSSPRWSNGPRPAPSPGSAVRGSRRGALPRFAAPIYVRRPEIRASV